MKWERVRPGHYLAMDEGRRFEISRTSNKDYHCAAYDNADTPYAAESFYGRTLSDAKQALEEIAAGIVASALRPPDWASKTNEEPF